MRKLITLLSILIGTVFMASANVGFVGNSFITVNDLWYTGSHGYEHDGGYFHGAELGNFDSNFMLGGEVQVWEYQETDATMSYKIDNGDVVNINLPKTGSEGNNSKHSGTGTISIANLGAGEHTIAVWFHHSNTYDSNNGENYVATFIVVEKPSVNFSDLKAYAFEGDQITLNATAKNVDSPVYTYFVKLPESENFETEPITSLYSPSAIGAYTFKVDVAEDGDATILASTEKEVTVLEIPEPITITVQVPDSWDNTHFWYWTTFDGLGGWVEPTQLTNTAQDGAKVYRYTFTHFDELNFLVANGNNWDASPAQTINTLDVKEKSCYLIDDSPNSETGEYGIAKVACDMLVTSVEKTKKEPIIIRINNRTIDVNLDKQASVELYAITGQQIRTAHNVNSFTQKVNPGIYVLRIDGKARKVLVADY